MQIIKAHNVDISNSNLKVDLGTGSAAFMVEHNFSEDGLLVVNSASICNVNNNFARYKGTSAVPQTTHFGFLSLQSKVDIVPESPPISGGNSIEGSPTKIVVTGLIKMVANSKLAEQDDICQDAWDDLSLALCIIAIGQ